MLRHQPLMPSRKERRTNAGAGTYTLPLSRAPPAASGTYEGLVLEGRGMGLGLGRVGCCRTCCNLFCPLWTPDMIDRASAVAFPTVFSLFNIIYWTYYSLV